MARVLSLISRSLISGWAHARLFRFRLFSFVVGMTCQVSDVQIISRKMRRLTLLHSVRSFGFNTVILALLINTVSSLL